MPYFHYDYGKETKKNIENKLKFGGMVGSTFYDLPNVAHSPPIESAKEIEINMNEDCFIEEGEEMITSGI